MSIEMVLCLHWLYLASSLILQQTQKELKLHTISFMFLEEIKPLQLLIQTANFPAFQQNWILRFGPTTRITQLVAINLPLSMLQLLKAANCSL